MAASSSHVVQPEAAAAAAERDRPGALILGGARQSSQTGAATSGPESLAATGAGPVPPRTPGAADATVINLPQPATTTTTIAGGTPPPRPPPAAPGGPPKTQKPRFLQGAKIRWYTFTSQVVVSLLTMVFAMVMLSMGGQTSMYLAIMTSVLGNYFPNERLYLQTNKRPQQPAVSGAEAALPAAPTAAGGTAAAGRPAQQPASAASRETAGGQAADAPPPLTAEDIARELEDSDDADISMSFARFIMQTSFAVIILVFCMVQVGRARVNAAAANRMTVLPEENTYLPVITAIHAFFMPPPGTKKAGKS